MGEDGSVVIGVDMNISDAEKELSRLQKKVIDLETKINKAEFKKSGLLEQSKQMAAKLDEAKAKLNEMESAVRGVYSKDAIKEQRNIVSALQSDWNKIENEIDRCDKTIRDANVELEYTKQRFVEVEQQARKMGSGGFLSVVFQKVVSMLQKIPNIAKISGKSILNAAKNINVFHKATKSIGPALKKLGGMIKRVFVFSVITAGLRAAREKLSEYLSVNTQLSNSLSQLKGAFLTAFNPILESVVPIINTLINVMTRAILVTSQFIATLFGTTAKQARTNAKALEEQAAATAGAGKAAKEASKSLANFDEINKLDGSSDSTGGGGASASAIEDAFDFDLDNTAFDSWGEAFLWMLDKIDGGIARLKNAFGNFATWFNDLNQKLYDMFTFPGVREKVEQIGNDLADALNYLVASIDWYKWGQALGAGFDLGLLFLTTAIYGFDWINLGRSLAALVNGIVSEVDWYNFGMLLWAGFKLGIETLAGFILGMDMVQLAQAASNIVMGFFDSMTDTITSINWEEIGHQIAVFLSNVNWAGVAQSTFTAIGAAFGAAAAFLWGLIRDAWQAVVNWWHEKAFEDGQFTLLGLLNGILEVISGIGEWIRDNIFQPFINGFKSVFGISSPSTVMVEMGGYLIEGLKNGLSNLWESVKGIFSGALDSIKGTLSSESLKNVGTNMVNGLMNGVKGVTSKMKDWASSILSSVKDKLGIHSPSTETESVGFYLVKGMVNGVNENSKSVVEAFGAILAQINKMCADNVDQMTDAFVEFLKYLSTEFSSKWTSTFSTLYSSAYTYIQKVISEINALNAKLASIERNIVITITTVYKTSGDSGGSSSTSKSAKSISIPPGVTLGPIPALATGTVIPPNRRFLAELGDNKQEPEVVSPLSTMKQAFKEAMMEIGYSGNSQQEAVMMVDGEVFGRLSYKLGGREGKRIGVNLVEA